MTAVELPAGIELQPEVGAPGRIPLWVKVAYTAFVAVLVPFYWVTYGPTNFLYFCDVALLMALVALWWEKPLLASMPAVGILIPQAVWMADFLGGTVGRPLIGMTAYMFDEKLSLFARGLSFFHFWLPLLLLWAVWRMGYDRRALLGWTVLAWALQLICYFAMPAPPAPPENPNVPVNINYVYGFNEAGPQIWMAPGAFLALMMVGMPLLVFLPTHAALNWAFAPAPVAATSDES